MKRSAGIVISMCFAVLPYGAMATKPALAAQFLGPGEAAAHLASAHAAAVKCNHLTQDLRDELSNYVNMAEVVVAGHIGPEAVGKVMDQGRVQGRNMTCGVESEDLALSAMEAAREAMQQSGASSADLRGTSQDEPRVETAETAARVAPAQAQAAPAKEKPKKRKKARASSAALATYTRATAAYYVERRCNHLARRRAVAFWKKVVARHNAMLSRHDGAAVAKAKARAVSIARSTGACGTRTARLVKSGYSLVSRN